MKKVLYISNVNLNGKLLPGVVQKILGQEKAFKAEGFVIDMLFPVNDKIVLKNNEGKEYFFKGARKEYSDKGIISKAITHAKVSIWGSINFSDCFPHIAKAKYDAIYLRFFLPGIDLIKFLKRLKQLNPKIILLLEYPTLNIKELYQTSFVRKVSFLLNKKKVARLNGLSDYIITLTEDKNLFGKPTVFMPNGIDTESIMPIKPLEYNSNFKILGVASDVGFYHGFDKIIKGIANYYQRAQTIKIELTIVSNPLSNHLDELKELTLKLGLEEYIHFEPMKKRDELEIEYSQTHFAIGTLALHRIGLMDNYSLKHREYAAFGLPFVMSLGDKFFENSPFVFVVDRDEEAIDMEKLIAFYSLTCRKYPNYPEIFRKSIEEKISWKAQMQQVFNVINNHSTGIGKA